MSPLNTKVESVYAIVPAAGSSLRMGTNCSKALLKIGKTTVIERTVRALLDSEYIKHIVILARSQDQIAFQDLFSREKSVSVVMGGSSRQ